MLAGCGSAVLEILQILQQYSKGLGCLAGCTSVVEPSVAECLQKGSANRQDKFGLVQQVERKFMPTLERAAWAWPGADGRGASHVRPSGGE